MYSNSIYLARNKFLFNRFNNRFFFYRTGDTPQENSTKKTDVHETSPYNQLKCLLHRGYLKCKRDPVRKILNLFESGRT